MARHRFSVDLVTEDPLSPRQLSRLASDLSDSLQAVISSEIEGRDKQKIFAHGHLHVSTEQRACDTCVQLARDEQQ